MSFFQSLFSKAILKSLVLLFVAVAGISSFNFAILSSDSQFNSVVNVNNKWVAVQNIPNSERDLGFAQQTVEALCEAFDPNFNPSKKPCNLSNQKFRENAGFNYFGSSTNISSIYDGLMNAVRSGGYRNFIFPSFTFNSFVTKYIREFETPDNPLDKPIRLLTIDTYYQPDPGDEWPENFWQIKFNQAYSGYHAGVYAAVDAYTNPDKFIDGDLVKAGKQIKFASLLGLEITPILNYVFGFMLGLEQIKNSSLGNTTDVELDFVGYKVLTGFANSTHGAITKTFAQNYFIEERVSVIFTIAGELSLSVYASAIEADKQLRKSKDNDAEGHYVIGVDVDQGLLYLDENPESADGNSKFLTSAVIGIRSEFANIIKSIIISDEGGEPFKGADRFISRHKSDDGEGLSTIPKRYKTTEIWKIAKEVLGDRLDLGHAVHNDFVDKVNDLTKIYAGDIPKNINEDPDITSSRIAIAKKKIKKLSRSLEDFSIELSAIYDSIQI